MKESTPKPQARQEIASGLKPKDLLALPGKQALELILESLTPARLVQSLAEEDLFWLVQNIGLEGALPILSRATNDQWQYLMDLELWRNDRLDMNSANRWLGVLFKADPQRFLIWALDEHIELIELLLSKNIEVRIKDEDESPADLDERYFSLDGVLYIHILQEEHYHTIREFLECLAAHDFHRFHQVLLEFAGLMPSEAEENMYRLRNVRLAEKGFLPFEEAVGIYQYMSPKGLMKKGPEVQKVMQDSPMLQVVPVMNSLLIQDQGLFYLALKHIQDTKTLEELQLEFTGMCNQIISADGLVAREKADLVAVVRKACGYLDIALQRLTDADLETATRILGKFRLEQVFRVGYGAALEIKWKADKWFKQSWFATQDLGLGFWGDKWEGILEGLFRRRPLYYSSLAEEREPYREFRSMEDIAHCHQTLEQVMAFDRILSLVLAHTCLTDSPEALEPVSYSNLLLTCWARYHLGLQAAIQPLSVEELKTLFQDLWSEGEKPRQIREAMKQSFLDWLSARSGLVSNEIRGQVGTTLESLFSELENEYGAVSLGDLDPRYIRHFLVAL